MSYLMLPPLDLDLAHRTADLLRIPHLVCRKRSCRRAGFCKWAGERTKLPYCLRNLDINQLGLFMQRYEDCKRQEQGPLLPVPLLKPHDFWSPMRRSR